MTRKMVPARLQDLFEAATRARKNAYAPYSRYRVGAAIRLEDGSVFSGCNVENSTYGATTCAEQIAVFKAVSEKGKIRIAEVMVITESDPPASPCGICRQVLAEFGPKAVIHASNPKGRIKTLKLGSLLPDAFTPEHLDR
jgi:cytidine deaminase